MSFYSSTGAFCLLLGLAVTRCAVSQVAAPAPPIALPNAAAPQTAPPRPTPRIELPSDPLLPPASATPGPRIIFSHPVPTDQRAADWATQNAYRASNKPMDPKVAALLKQYEELDSEANGLAKKIQGAGDVAGDDLRKYLNDVVTKQFNVRQQIRDAEVQKLRDRLAVVERSLKKRADAKTVIVSDRISELLNENYELKWDSPLTSASAYKMVPVQGGYGETVHVQLPDYGLGGTLRKIYPAPTASQPPTANPLVRGASVPKNSQQSDYFAIEAAEIELKRAEQLYDGTKVLFEAGETTTAERDNASASRELARVNLARAKQAYNARRQILELELQGAQATLEAQTAALNVKNAAKDSIPEVELLAQKAEVAKARIALERAKIELDLHNGTGRTKESTPVDPAAKAR